MEPQAHRFATTAEAYNASQCSDDIKDGDVLIAEQEGVVGIMVSAWPTALEADGPTGAFHALADGLTWESWELEEGRYAASAKLARERAEALAEWKRRDDLITEALGVAPGETLTIDINDAAPAAEGSTMADITTAAGRRANSEARQEARVPMTADDLAGDGIEAVRAGKAPYARMRANGKTLAYADDRKAGVVLSVASKDVAKAPKRFTKVMTVKGDRATMHVTSKNVKTARALLEWLAK